jgi:hypothetical protein
VRVRFAETMAGNLRSPDGEHAVAFTVTATDEGRGMFRLEGRTRAEPWVEAAPSTGVLVLRPRALTYRVRFAGPGGYWTIEGHKSPRLRALLRTMTVLPVELRDATGAVRAAGDLRFDLRDLPAFAWSWIRGPGRR